MPAPAPQVAALTASLAARAPEEDAAPGDTDTDTGADTDTGVDADTGIDADTDTGADQALPGAGRAGAEATSQLGILRLVATPIGNLGDMTPRAVEALRRADVVLAEDTRRARALCSHLGLTGKRIERFDAEAERRHAPAIVARLAAGESFALVTDAGMPVVSDPGAHLVSRAAAAGITVSPVPGPCAVTAAVAASGFGGGFRFLGFLARGGAERERAFERIAHTEEPVVLFESAERLAATLCELALRWPTRQAVVARELTKRYEELVRGELATLAAVERRWQGEITLVLGPMAPVASVALADADLDARLDALRAGGLHPRAAAKALALETGLPAAQIYARILAARG